jgi:selenocysteine lyase/cysteine desulfurase
MLDVDRIRARFPALDRTGEDGRPFVWVDAPGGSQVPDTVIEAVAGRYRRGLSNTHGGFPTSEETDAVIAEARRTAADLTGADPGEIVFGPNATTLLLHLSRSFAKTLRPGDEVVLTRLDHDANVRPWALAAADAGATVRWVDVDERDVTLDLASFDDALTERTKLVAFTLASNAVGTIPRVLELVRRAKSMGALVALDGVHFAQHRLMDLHGAEPTSSRAPRTSSSVRTSGSWPLAESFSRAGSRTSSSPHPTRRRSDGRRERRTTKDSPGWPPLGHQSGGEVPAMEGRPAPRLT